MNADSLSMKKNSIQVSCDTFKMLTIIFSDSKYSFRQKSSLVKTTHEIYYLVISIDAH